MRQHAWLNATPERAKGDKSEAPLKSRLEQLKQGDPDFEPEMPPLEVEYLVYHLFDVGPTVLSGGYSSPLSYQELEAWKRLRGIELQPWESKFLVNLSRQYVAESYRAQKRDAKEPMLEMGGVGVDKLLTARNLQRMVEEMSRL